MKRFFDNLVIGCTCYSLVWLSGGPIWASAGLGFVAFLVDRK